MRFTGMSMRFGASYVLIVLSYIAFYGISMAASSPTQSALRGDSFIWLNLIYLPHSVSVLATIFFEWRAVPALLSGYVLAVALFSGEWASALEMLSIQFGTLAAISPLIAFWIFRYLFRRGSAADISWLNWKDVMVIGALSSIFNAFEFELIFGDVVSEHGLLTMQLISVAGDMTGLIVVMVSLMMIFRWIRLAEK